MVDMKKVYDDLTIINLYLDSLKNSDWRNQNALEFFRNFSRINCRLLLWLESDYLWYFSIFSVKILSWGAECKKKSNHNPDHTSGRTINKRNWDYFDFFLFLLVIALTKWKEVQIRALSPIKGSLLVKVVLYLE